MNSRNRKYIDMVAAAVMLALFCPLVQLRAGDDLRSEKENGRPGKTRFSKEEEVKVKHLVSMLRSPYSKRKKVAEKLAAFGRPVLTYILPELKTNDSIMHLGTIDVLKALGDSASIDRLLELVERDEKGLRRTKTDVRVYAADVILQLGTEEMKNRVIQTVDDSDDFYVKELIKLFGKHKVQKAIPKISAMALENTTDLMTAVSVCRSLNAYGSAQATAVLAGFLSSEDIYLRRLSLVLLAENAFGSKYKAAILKCLNSGKKEELEEACRTCGKLKLKEAISRLLKLVRDDACSYFVRWEALDALVKIGDNSVAQKLEEIAVEIKGEASLIKKAQQVIRELESKE